MTVLSDYVVCTACREQDKETLLEEEVAPSCSDMNYLRCRIVQLVEVI